MKKHKTNIKFIAKNVEVISSFWVENYSEEEKKFFTDLGFTETDYSHIPKGFKINNNLSFRGSGPFGFWSDKEKDLIFRTMHTAFYKKDLIIHKFYEE